MKKITLLMAAIVVATVAMAQMSGIYKVGTAELAPNFTSLSAAVTALNANVFSADVVLEITSDITEAANIGLGVDTKGFGITIKPQANVSPTITFTLGTNPVITGSIDGCFEIGSPTFVNTNLIPTNNVVIDGSNTINGTTKNLTIMGPVTTTQKSVFRIFGNNDNITIKNCIITNRSTSGSSTAPINVTNYDVSNKAPDNLTIQNNTLNSVDGNGSTVIHMSNSGSPTVGITGLVIKDNVMFGRQRGMFISYTNGADIYGNTISEISQASQGSAAITLQTNFGTAGTFNIYNNNITALTTLNATAGASNGVIGIDNQCVTPKIVNIYNNTISGMGAGATATTNSKIYAIRVTSTSTCNVYHNTIYMPEMTDMTVFGTSYIAGIVFASAASTEASPAAAAVTTIKNNIIISDETSMKTWGIRRVGATGTFNSDYNIIYRANTTNGFVGYYNATDATDLAAWQTATSQDPNSKSIAVNFADVAIGDLRLTGASIQDDNLSVPSITEVATDMFGTFRGTIRTYAGAHESTAFVITSINQSEQTARIMRTSTGVEVVLDGQATIELYNINGMLIEKTNANGTYTRDLNNGVYIIRINGKATKFIK